MRHRMSYWKRAKNSFTPSEAADHLRHEPTPAVHAKKTSFKSFIRISGMTQRQDPRPYYPQSNRKIERAQPQG